MNAITRAAMLAALFAAQTGCSMARPAARCFTTRTVVLPDPHLVQARLSGGQAGRDLADAVWRGDADGARAMLARDPRLAMVRVAAPEGMNSAPDGQYGDLLTFAVARCDGAMIDALLDAGVPVDGAAPGAALTLALLSDDPTLPERLLRRGASPDPQKSGGRNAFLAVASANHPAGAAMLLRHGLDLGWRDAFGHSHLDNALSMQVYAIAWALVEAGADLRSADMDGFTPAHALAQPPAMSLDAREEAARQRLIARAQADGRGWPPARPPARR